jgi:hypothetical protein
MERCNSKGGRRKSKVKTPFQTSQGTYTDDVYCRFVLQNNILFRLAAQPPADIVGLKQILNKPSAPVRNRMTGLLEVIRETVRKELSRPPPLSDRPSSSAVAMDGDVPISEVGLAKITQQDQQPLLDVWNRIEGVRVS